MRSFRTISFCLALIALIAGCSKETTPAPGSTGNKTTTPAYPNDSLVNNGALFYVIADVEGVPGQSKMLVESNYYNRTGTSFFQCFGGGYSSYTVNIPRNSGTPSHWVNQLIFDFDSGMVHNGGYIVKTGTYTFTAPGQTYANHLRLTAQTTNIIYDNVDATVDNHFEIDSIRSNSKVMYGKFNCTMKSNSGETAVLKNGLFKLTMQ